MWVTVVPPRFAPGTFRAVFMTMSAVARRVRGHHPARLSARHPGRAGTRGQGAHRHQHGRPGTWPAAPHGDRLLHRPPDSRLHPGWPATPPNGCLDPLCILIPCHRVVGATSSIAGYAGGLDRKGALLEIEHSGALRAD